MSDLLRGAASEGWVRWSEEIVHAVVRIVLVQDNLNTHKPASLYAAFSPEEARRLINKLEIDYTPKHGSWLNMAEIELGILGRQGPDRETLHDEVAAWQCRRNETTSKTDWQFTTADARVKLKRLYPVLETTKPNPSPRNLKLFHQ